MLWSQRHCHETTLPERHSTIKRCKRKTVKSEKYKVKVESFKPAQERQRSSPCISFPTDFLQAEAQNKAVWINPHYVCSFPKLFCPVYPSLTSPQPQDCTSITGFQKKLLVWELALEILPSSEPNAEISSFTGRQTVRIRWYAGWFNLAILCWEELKSRSKEPFPFWGTSKGFNCIWVYIYTAHLHQHSSIALSSQEGSTHLLCHKRLEVSGSTGHCQQSWNRHWKHSSPHLHVREPNVTSLCLQQTALEPGKPAEEGRPMLSPHQTRITERIRATIKAENNKQYSRALAMVALCYVSTALNYEETPGEKEGKEICTLWVGHLPCYKKGIKGQNNERAGINVVSSLITLQGRMPSAVLWLLLKSEIHLPFQLLPFITADY